MEFNRNELIAVGTSSTKVSDAKAVNKRTEITIINTSTNNERITISIDAEAVDLRGRVLYPGGSWSTTRGDTYFPTQKQINCISDQATAQISLSETYGEDR